MTSITTVTTFVSECGTGHGDYFTHEYAINPAGEIDFQDVPNREDIMTMDAADDCDNRFCEDGWIVGMEGDREVNYGPCDCAAGDRADADYEEAQIRAHENRLDSNRFE